VNGGEHRNRSIIGRDKDLCKGQHLQTRKENFHPIPVFSLLVPTSKSRHHFSFSCTLESMYSSIIHLSYSFVFRFFDSLPSSLLVCVILYIRPSSFFLSSIPLVYGTLPFPLSLSACSSFTLPSLCNLAFLCPLLAPISNIFLALFLPLLVPSIARSPHFLSYSSHTSHYLICLNKCYHIALLSRFIFVSENETFNINFLVASP
jgi:hypothetical protein